MDTHMSGGFIKKDVDGMPKNIVKGSLRDPKIEDKDIYEIYNN